MDPELPFAIAANIKYFTGRKWLLPKLLSWLEQSNDRVFLLTGGPGTGKSMAMAWLAGAGPTPTDPTVQSQLEQIRSSVAAVHYCQAASRNITPQAFAENIANQLTRRVSRFAEALSATLAERVQINVSQQIGTVEAGANVTVTGVMIGRIDLGNLGDELSFDRTFTQPIKKLYADGYDKIMLILIDALDEAQIYKGNVNLVQLLSELADLPTQVRFIETTRSDPRVDKYFLDVSKIDLIEDAPFDNADVRIYVAQRLASEVPGLESEKRDLLAMRIGEEAKDVFLYGHMVVNNLLSHLSDIPDLENYPLPKGLSRLYHNFLNREIGRDDNRWYETFRPLLGLIAVARGSGLTRTQLSRIIGKEVELPLRACKQYLAGDIPEGPFRIFDRSFAEFLLEDADNRDYRVNAQEMHWLITNYYLQNYSRNWLLCDSYGLYHLIEHTLASGMNDQERKATFNRILTDEFVNAIQERTGWLYAFIEGLEALAKVEPNWAASLCFTLVLDRPPNSLVIQHALQLLIRLRPDTGPVGDPDNSREEGLDKVVQILSDKAGDTSSQLLAALKKETDDRVRGAISLALAETGNPEVAPCLLEMFKKEYRTASWAAADALIALNHRAVISELIGWYQELQNKNDPTNRARMQRILYVLGWMHAEEAQVLKPIALTSSYPMIIGRAVDFAWLLKPTDGDESYLLEQLLRILASSPERPQNLGPWADEWLQKRVVRALLKLHVAGILTYLRQLQEHIHRRRSPKQAAGGAKTWSKAARRVRLIEAVEEGITELQIGR